MAWPMDPCTQWGFRSLNCCWGRPSAWHDLKIEWWHKGELLTRNRGQYEGKHLQGGTNFPFLEASILHPGGDSQTEAHPNYYTPQRTPASIMHPSGGEAAHTNTAYLCFHRETPAVRPNTARRQNIHQVFVKEKQIKGTGSLISAVEAVFLTVSNDLRFSCAGLFTSEPITPEDLDAGRRNKAQVKELPQPSRVKMPWRQEPG